MKLGVVGLPNVGKSSLFNAITRAGAASENYPFCTIEPNVGIVSVPDTRLDYLANIYDPEKFTPATIELVDIAGLVRGASKGEGLGNKFLSHIREVDAILQVVRCFSDDNIVGNINLPAVAPNCRIVQVSGDSMTPIINSGDMVAIREIESTEIIFWGQIYVVILDDYRLVKYLRKHDDPSMVILRSENPNYDDIEVPRSKIRQLFLVQNVIRIDSRL